jgi:hypothetical protein
LKSKLAQIDDELAHYAAGGKPSTYKGMSVGDVGAAGETATGGSGKFVEGKVYIDAKGNKAKYVNGQFVEIP